MKTLKSIDLYPNGLVGVKYDVDGKPERTVFFPGQDIADQPEAVKAVCRSVWTQPVIDAYNTSLEK